MGFDPTLYLVTDPRLGAPRPLLDTVAAAVSGGVTLVQLRDPDAPTRALVETARALVALLRPRGVPLIVNDRVDVALAADADGVHVGQSDMLTADARTLIGPDRILGLSITDASEMRPEDLGSVDYLGVGPIYLQATKPNAAPPIGPEGLAAIRAMTRLPIVAIGGVGPANAERLIRAGADGLSVVSALMAAPDPGKAARALIETIARARG
jgi:thiamine-phosphate pyrophosphorylase